MEKTPDKADFSGLSFIILDWEPSLAQGTHRYQVLRPFTRTWSIYRETKFSLYSRTNKLITSNPN